jgi:hypothetical protein
MFRPYVQTLAKTTFVERRFMGKPWGKKNEVLKKSYFAREVNMMSNNSSNVNRGERRRNTKTKEMKNQQSKDTQRAGKHDGIQSPLKFTL